MNAPARTWGGRVHIHPSGSVNKEQRALIESFGIVVLEETSSAGEAVLLVYGDHESVKSLLQSPDIAATRLAMDLSFWPLEKGVPLVASTILKGPRDNGFKVFH